MCTSLEESQALVQTRDRIVEDLTGKIKAQQGDIESLKSAKNEVCFVYQFWYVWIWYVLQFPQ